MHLSYAMHVLEWIAAAAILGWAGVSYSLLRISARPTPKPVSLELKDSTHLRRRLTA